MVSRLLGLDFGKEVRSGCDPYLQSGKYLRSGGEKARLYAPVSDPSCASIVEMFATSHFGESFFVNLDRAGKNLP